ncbi:MAG: 16S rRNA (cytosine(1402)-N(4))-methyltransferase, partial [Pseudomonadota bacterium]
MAQQLSAPHVPVLLNEVVAAVAPAPGKIMVDGTFGAGGYTAALLAGGARVYAFDRDPSAIAAGAAMVAAHDGQLSLHERRFSEMADELSALGVPELDAVVLDIG